MSSKRNLDKRENDRVPLAVSMLSVAAAAAIVGGTCFLLFGDWL
jgi:hypothetical protein